MADKDDWIKLQRKLVKWEWYSNANVSRVFIHILLTVNYKPTKFQGYDIPAGAAVYGRKELSESLGLSEMQIRGALSKLKTTNEITIKTTNKFSIIQLVKWNDYQSLTSKTTNKQPTSNQQVTTDKEGKNIRKDYIQNDFEFSDLNANNQPGDQTNDPKPRKSSRGARFNAAKEAFFAEAKRRDEENNSE